MLSVWHPNRIDQLLKNSISSLHVHGRKQEGRHLIYFIVRWWFHCRRYTNQSSKLIDHLNQSSKVEVNKGNDTLLGCVNNQTRDHEEFQYSKSKSTLCDQTWYSEIRIDECWAIQGLLKRCDRLDAFSRNNLNLNSAIVSRNSQYVWIWEL
jgi:hypothetical protein